MDAMQRCRRSMSKTAWLILAKMVIMLLILNEYGMASGENPQYSLSFNTSNGTELPGIVEQLNKQLLNVDDDLCKELNGSNKILKLSIRCHEYMHTPNDTDASILFWEITDVKCIKNPRFQLQYRLDGNYFQIVLGSSEDMGNLGLICHAENSSSEVIDDFFESGLPSITCNLQNTTDPQTNTVNHQYSLSFNTSNGNELPGIVEQLNEQLLNVYDDLCKELNGSYKIRKLSIRCHEYMHMPNDTDANTLFWEISDVKCIENPRFQLQYRLDSNYFQIALGSSGDMGKSESLICHGENSSLMVTDDFFVSGLSLKTSQDNITCQLSLSSHSNPNQNTTDQQTSSGNEQDSTHRADTPIMTSAQAPVTDTVTFTSEIGITDLQPSPVNERKIGKCPCPKGDNETNEQKEEFTKEVLAKITIDRNKIKAYLAKYISAPDKRPTAQYVGWIGAVFLGVAVLIPVFFDLLNVIIYIDKVKTKSRCELNGNGRKQSTRKIEG